MDYKLGDKIRVLKDIYIDGKLRIKNGEMGFIYKISNGFISINFKYSKYDDTIKIPQNNTAIIIDNKLKKGDLIITQENIYDKNNPNNILVPKGTKGVIVDDIYCGYNVNFVDLNITDSHECFNNYLRTNNVLWTMLITNYNQISKLSIAKPITKKVNLNKNINKRGNDIMKNTFEIKGIEVKDNGATFRVDSVKVEVDYSVTEAIKLTDATVKIMPQLVNVFNKLIK